VTPDDIKTWVEIVQGIATTVGIVAAGIWSFFTFVLGRSFAPNMQITFELKQVVDLKQRQAAIVLVKIKNIGKTRVRKKRCYIATALVADSGSGSDIPELTRLDESLDFSTARVYRIFDAHATLEPDEGASEDVLFALGESPAFKVGLIFTDRRNNSWISSAILDIRTLRAENEGHNECS
jgi:hypothetical protein